MAVQLEKVALFLIIYFTISFSDKKMDYSCLMFDGWCCGVCLRLLCVVRSIMLANNVTWSPSILDIALFFILVWPGSVSTWKHTQQRSKNKADSSNTNDRNKPTGLACWYRVKHARHPSPRCNQLFHTTVDFVNGVYYCSLPAKLMHFRVDWLKYVPLAEHNLLSQPDNTEFSQTKQKVSQWNERKSKYSEFLPTRERTFLLVIRSL
jgi:hypothetical protein